MIYSLAECAATDGSACSLCGWNASEAAENLRQEVQGVLQVSCNYGMWHCISFEVK